MNAAMQTNGRLSSPAQTKLVVLLCWLVLSIFGAVFVGVHWTSKGQLGQALVRVGFFEAIITCICVAGYLLYRRQSVADQSKHADRASSVYTSADFKSALIDGLKIQIPILVLTALLLDGGRIFHIATVAAFSYWSMAGLLAFRRRISPSFGDLLAIRYGYIFILLLVRSIGPMVWTHLGRW